MANRFNRRMYLVTGAARGIGRAIGQRLLEEGAIVYLGDIDPFRERQPQFAASLYELPQFAISAFGWVRALALVSRPCRPRSGAATRARPAEKG